MLYRTMPKNGDQLSVLGYGCMRLPMQDGQIDEARAIAQIRSAIDSGINYVDTAWPYHNGASEPLVGKALQDGYRERVKLATKLPSWLIKSREDMDQYLNDQLEKLQTDHIDYYLIHALDGALWDKVESHGINDFLEKALQDGRIRNAGFSFHGVLDDFKRIIDAYPWTFCQIQYNYMDQQFQAGTEGLLYAAAKDIGVIIMEPLRGGMLSHPTPPPAIAQLWNEAPTERSPAAWGLRWIWNHPEVTVVLSGMNEEAHIEENLSLAEQGQANTLTQEELTLVDRVKNTYKELLQVGCTGCGYCLPCPMGVKIPTSFDCLNKLHLFGNPAEAKQFYIVFTSGVARDEAPGLASQCVSCGLCLEKCPQHIAIPDMLEKVVADLEGPDFPERLAAAKKRMGVE